jgi:cysteinyl-tRNA synthetase
MIDLVNEHYKKNIAFHEQEIKKVDKEIERIKILAFQTTDDRVYNAEIKQLEIKKEALESSLKIILNDYSRYKESVEEANEIF